MPIMTVHAIDRAEQAVRKMRMGGHCHGCNRDQWLTAGFTDAPGSDRVVYLCKACGFENSEPHPPEWGYLA